jgi:hypothetical protein
MRLKKALARREFLFDLFSQVPWRDFPKRRRGQLTLVIPNISHVM